MDINLKYDSPFDVVVNSTVDKSEIDGIFYQVYNDLSNTPIKGFRKKKIPMSVIKVNFSNKAKAMVGNILINKVYEDLNNKSLNIIKPTSEFASNNKLPQEGSDYKFTLTFNIQPMPKINSTIKGMLLDKLNILVNKKDIDSKLNLYATEGGEKRVVENRGALENDILIADVRVELDGEYCKSLSKNPGTIHLAKNSCPDEMIASLVGIKPSEIREFFIKPNNKSSISSYIEQVQRKYIIKLYKLVEITKSELNENLAKKFNFRSVTELKDHAKKITNFENSIDIRRKIEKQICDILLKDQKAEVSKKDIESQKNVIALDLHQNMIMCGLSNEKIQQHLKKIDHELEAESIKQCSLELIISKLILDLGIKVTDQDIEEALKNIHLRDGIPLSELKKQYSNRQAILSLEFSIAKNRVFDHIISNAKFNETGVS